jgi:hypothetical protein
VLLFSTNQGAHELMLRLFRNRGMPVAVSAGGDGALSLLGHAPAFVLVDLNHGPALGKKSIDAINRLREKCTVLGIHDGNLDRFATQLDALVVNAYCDARNWRKIVDLAASTLLVSVEMSHH